MKKQYFLLAVLLVLLAGLSFLSIQKYQHTPKNVTVHQAISQRDTALINLQVAKQLDDVHQQAATNTITGLKTQNTTLTTTNTTLCAQIKSAKLVQPLCK